MTETKRDTRDCICIQNIVGTGSLDVEVDLTNVAEDVDFYEKRYEPETYHGLYLRSSPDSPLITLWRTGKYNIVGAKTISELKQVQADFLDGMASIGVINELSDDSFSISNVVATANLEQSLELNALAVELGLEDVEYEPEQFPGLIYHLSDPDCIVLIFGSGSLVITGIQSVEDASQVFRRVQKRIDKTDN